MDHQALSILIVEDDPAHAEAVRRALETSWDTWVFRHAETLAESRRAIADALPDLVISDLNLADGKAYDLLPDNGDGVPYPLLVMTSHGDEQMAVQAMKSGALDYVVKSPETFAEMPRLVERVLREWQYIRERRVAEAALRESRRRLSDIIDFLPDATFAIDVDGRVIAWNRAVEKMTGVAKEAILGQTGHVYAVPFYGIARPVLLDLVLHDDLDLQANYDFVRREGDRLIAEVFDPHIFGGRGAYLWITASPLYDGDGKRVGAIESVRDITESKRAQNEIARAYGESRAITQAVRDTLYMIDLEGHLLWWNKHMEEVTGLAPGELSGRLYLDFFVEEDVAKVAASLREAMATGFAELEARIKTIAGIVPYHYHGVLVRDDLGKVIGIAGVGRDISEQVRSREKLRLSATVLESTREGVMVTDANGILVAVNHAFTEITGYSESEALGRHPRMLQSGRQERDFYQAMWASIGETGHWQGEIWNRDRRGKIYPEWLTISAVRNAEGETVNYVGVFSDISHIKQSEAKLERLAHYDPLTDLPNRLLLTSRLRHAIDKAERGKTELAVLFLDLDNFKHVNDSLGHPAGDELLRVIAKRLQTRIREGDTLARLGGDEFVVVLETLRRSDEAAMVAQSVIQLMEEPFMLPGGHEIYIGVSVGISLYPDNGQDATQLIRNADTAMYLAKSQGRNTYRFYTSALTAAANQRLNLESKLRRALERGEFVLHYQPQVSIPDGRIVGMEALLRWHHPEEGLIPPLRFIPLAEETGLIQPIGKWVLRTACAQLRAWVDQGMPLLTMAVNLSPRQFAQPDLVEQVREALEFGELPAQYLELEITESAIMDSGEKARTTLKALKDLGITLSIDDFGTGYSSLAYLKQLPIDKLKIDKSFVDGIPDDRNDAAITATIISMAKNLNLSVLAEGVETEAQRHFLSEPGCDAYQGYLFSRPLPAADIAAMCLNSSCPVPGPAMSGN
jgi:diguanylate cyclase (GGDEF)-like protein/PAS domain S-box-containing protein